MIIKLHQSLIDDLENNEFTEDEIEALADIASLRKNGRGFVLADKKLLIKLAQHNAFAQYTRNSFTQIYRDQTKWFNLVNNFNFIINITSNKLNHHNSLTLDTDNIYIPLSEFKNRESVIIAENSIDIRFFTSLTKAYIKTKGIKGISLSYRSVLGGGDTTHQVINDHQSDQDGPAICILDSDKTYPGGNFGSTAAKVFELVKSEKLTKIITTESREVENIIPFSILKSIFSNNKMQLEKINKYEKFRDITLGSNLPIKYIDFKKGLKLCLANKKGDDEHNIFWRNTFSSLGIANICACISPKKCTCLIVDGFGSDLLRTVVEYLESNPFCFSKVEDIYEDELSFICENLIPFILAPHALAS
ncbi:hypothetical protein [Shewanella sp. TB7-MNA-CIBAN-0143]|jgi:hypothetical protein|uniref:hypothetical protein n=1 Tax=unclassified Shewanella TaxID=196818 RepID=UPI00332EB03F